MNEKQKEMSFFNKFYSSITKIELFPEFASRSWSVVFSYVLKLLVIFVLVVTICSLFQSKEEINSVILEKYGDVLNYISGGNITLVYIGMFFVTYIYMYIIYLTSMLLDVLLLGIFGQITALLMGLRLKYSAMCKVAVHSLTLPIVLNILATLLQTFANFKIKYFEIMYIGVACVYIVATILIIKSDVIKSKQELAKIIEEQAKVREELEKQEEQEEQEKKEKQKEDDDKKEEKDNKEKDDKENLDNNEPQVDNG